MWKVWQTCQCLYLFAFLKKTNFEQMPETSEKPCELCRQQCCVFITCDRPFCKICKCTRCGHPIDECDCRLSYLSYFHDQKTCENYYCSYCLCSCCLKLKSECPDFVLQNIKTDQKEKIMQDLTPQELYGGWCMICHRPNRECTCSPQS